MKEFEEKRLDAAITYISRMADGNNPTNNRPAQSDILDNPNVIRCLHFVKEVLEEVRLNNGKVGAGRKSVRKPFPFDVLKAFQYREDKSIMHLLRQFAEPVEDKEGKLPGAAAINKWLGANGYLERRVAPQNGKEYWVPSEKGKQLGLYEREGTSPDGRFYISVIYNAEAQIFMAENMELIAGNIESGELTGKSEKPAEGSPDSGFDAATEEENAAAAADQERQAQEDLYAAQWRQWEEDVPFREG